MHLTRTEWRMLEVLLRSAGQLVPAARLLTELWGPGAERQHPLPAVPHGPAAAEARRRPAAAAPPADRARHGLPVSALASAMRRSGQGMSHEFRGSCGRPGCRGARQPGPAEDLSRLRGWRRQDVRHAQRGAPAQGARHRRRRRLRRNARPPAHRRADRRPRGHPAGAAALPRHLLRGDGPGRRPGPPSGGRPGRRVRAHQRARLAQRQALAGRQPSCSTPAST